VSCNCCTHPDRDDIDAAIVAGESVRSIGARFGVSPWSVSRHHTRHLSPALTGTLLPPGSDGREPFPERLERLYALAEAMYVEAVSAGHGAQALNLLKEMRGQLETIGRATGQYDDRSVAVLNLHTAPEWIETRTRLVRALAPWPEAQVAASSVLELEAGQ